MQRAVVLMYCLITTDYAEIAAALGRTRATVRSHMHQALKHLRTSLEKVAFSAESEVDYERRLHRTT